MAEIGQDIARTQKLLEQGKLVAIPTETVYGLAADATDAEAVARIFEAKNRPHFDPLILHFYEARQLEDYCQVIPDLFYQLYEQFSPGAITYILPKTDKVPDIVTAGHSTVGIRFPRHPLTRELLQKIDRPLAAPSANPFGYISPTTAAHVEEQLGDRVDYILDGGACQVGVESTIVDLSSAKPKILRLGGIASEEIEAITGPLMVNRSSSSDPRAPGMLTSHYAPGTALVIGEVEKLLENYPRQKVAILSFDQSYPQVPMHMQRVLSHRSDLKEAAANLFAVLRQLDKMGADIILAEKFPDKGVGRAINDRLERAAARR